MSSRVLLRAAVLCLVLVPAALPATVQDDGAPAVTFAFDEPEGVPLLDVLRQVEELTGRPLEYRIQDVEDVRVRMLGEMRVEPDHLWSFLQLVLATHDLVLVPLGDVEQEMAGTAGLYAIRTMSGGGGSRPGMLRTRARVVAATELEALRHDVASIYTTSFPVHHVNVMEAVNLLQAYFTDPLTESARSLSSSNRVVVTGFGSHLYNIGRLLAEFDRPPAEPAVEVARIPLRHAPADQVRPVLERVLADDVPAGPGAPPTAPETPLRVAVDARTNSLLVVGSPNQQAQVLRIVERLDVQLPAATGGAVDPVADTRVRQLAHAQAAELAGTLQRWIQQAFGPDAAGAVTVVADARSNSLLITARQEDQARLDALIDQLDAARAPDDI